MIAWVTRAHNDAREDYEDGDDDEDGDEDGDDDDGDDDDGGDGASVWTTTSARASSSA